VRRRAVQRVERLVALARPFSDEPIVSAITCNLDGAPAPTSLPGRVKQAAEQMGLGMAADDLPSPLILAVGADWIHAFHYVQGWSGTRVVREVTRWSKDDLLVFVDAHYTECYLALGSRSGNSRVFDTGAMMFGAAQMFYAFTDALGLGTGLGQPQKQGE
jgi:hypothetical protein